MYMQQDFMLFGELVTLVKRESFFGPFYTVHKKGKLLGAIERVDGGGAVWHSLLFTPSNRTFKMPETRRTWRLAIEQLFEVEWFGNKHEWLANI